MAGARHFPIYKILALLLSAAVLLTTALGSTFAHIVTKTPSFINTFLSGLDLTGDLLISKEVSHPFGEGYLIPDDIRFTFTVSLGNNYAGKTVKTSQGEIKADESGSIIVTVAPDGAVRIKNLSNGTSVTVTEASSVGFTPNSGPQQSITVKAGENHIAYTNIYTPSPVSPVHLTVSGTKLLEGRDWQENDSFTFQLEYKLAGNETWQSAGTASVSYDPTKADFHKFSFSELVQGITYDTAGEYSFRVSEVEGTVPGITYDKVVSYFDVIVGDADMDGALEIQNVKGYQNAAASYDESTGNHHVAVTVNNKYAPVGTAAAVININKQVTSYSGEEKSAAGYTFELYDENGSLVAASGETSAAGETAIELTYEAKDAGKTLHYTLKETLGGEIHNGLIYADTVYPISVSVVDDLDGTISAYVYNTAELELIEIASEQDEPQQPQPEESATGETAPAPDVEIAADPALLNSSPENTEENTENLESNIVPETSSPSAEPCEPQIKEVTVIPEGACDTYAVSFVNVYDPADTSVSFGGSKELTGRSMKEGEFAFDLFVTGDNFTVAEGQTPVQSATNNAAGEFSFTSIAYSKVGIYRYVVKENDSARLGGITYDDSKFHVIVTVTDENGALKSHISITDEVGAAAEIKFRNSYKAAATSIALHGTKTLTGMELAANMFQFRLYQADANYTIQGAALAGAGNDASGQFTFDSIEYAETGTFYYVVKEDASTDIQGMTYDDTVYGVKISVWDDGSGTLKADMALTVVGGDAVDAILFENSYTEPVAPGAPPTGDNNAIALYITLVVISSAAMLLLLIVGTKKTKRRNSLN